MKFPKTKEGFYVFTNKQEIKDVFDKEYDNIILIDDVKLSKEDLANIEETKKGVLAVYYFDSMDEVSEIDDLYYDYRYEDKCLVGLWCLKEQHKVLDDILQGYNKNLPDLRSMADRYEILVHTDYEGLCGNCHEPLGKEDKYCRTCGTKRGEGAFKPYVNKTYCVYGPMIANKYACPKCGKTWSECNPGGRGDTYCPQCGTKIENTVELVSDIGPFILETEESVEELMKKLEEKAKEEQK